MTRRSIVPILLVAAACVAIAASLWNRGKPDEGPRIRRVVLVTIDTLRADALPAYGNRRIKTPTLSRLASEGVVFEDALAPSPWTRPSIASLLTGLPPAVHGFIERGFDRQSVYSPGVRTIGELFSAAGYRTGAFGFNLYLANSANLRRGFRDFVFFPALTLEKHPRYQPSKYPDALTGTEMVTELARKWAADHAADSTFLWVHYYDPHFPYTPPYDVYAPPPDRDPPRDERTYQTSVFEFNLAFEKTLIAMRDGLRAAAGIPVVDPTRAKPPLTRRDAAHARALYDGEVRHVDRHLAKLVADLERRGQLDETLIIVTSDHGEEFWEHGGVEHGHALHREVVHVPLIIRGPGVRRGARVRGRVTLMSLLPTSLELTGLPAAPQCVAPSLASSALNGEAPPAAGEVVLEHTLHGEARRAILLGSLKYTRGETTGIERLYDLSNDPGETTDLAASRPADCANARERIRVYDAWAADMRKLLRVQRAEADSSSEAARKLLREHGYLK